MTSIYSVPILALSSFFFFLLHFTLKWDVYEVTKLSESCCTHTHARTRARTHTHTHTPLQLLPAFEENQRSPEEVQEEETNKGMGLKSGSCAAVREKC